MVECSTDYIWYKKRRKNTFKRISVFFIVVTILISIILYYKFVITQQIYSICCDYVYSYSTEAVNVVSLNSVELTTDYTELVQIEKNNNGDIVLMKANAQKINKINKKIATETEKVLKQKLKNGVPIPLLAFSGIDLLRGYGPTVSYNPLTVSSVLCDFSSTFTSVGINQTLHTIYIEVITEVKVKSLFGGNTEKCANKILISEAVLVGKVPEIYLSGKIFG